MRTATIVALALAAVPALAASAGREWTTVSTTPSGGRQSGGSFEAAVSSGGRYVAFFSDSTDLTADPGPAGDNVFLRDVKTGATELVSRTPAGARGNGGSDFGCVSSNGRWVVFQSDATDLDAGDGLSQDVFAADRLAGEVRLVSAGWDGSPADAISYVYGSSLSSSGRWFVFQSAATNLVEGADTRGKRQIYLRDLRTGTTTLVSRDLSDPLSGADGACEDPSISPNGRFIVYPSVAANLVPGEGNGVWQVFLYDAKRGTTSLVTATPEGIRADHEAQNPVVSSSGRFVAFATNATNLAAPMTGGVWDVVLADRARGTFRNLSASAGGGESSWPSISASGRTVAFTSEKSDLVPGDGNATSDVFLFDVPSGTVRRATTTSAGVEGDGYSYTWGASLSPDGRWLAIPSDAGNLAGPEDPSNNTDTLLLRLR